MDRIKIGISHGDINGIGYELILKTFENEAMFDLCTPIIYGSPKVATYHRNTLGSQTSFVVLDSGTEAQNGQLNMVNCFGEDEVKIDLGQATDESIQAARTSLEHALNDLKAGVINVLVTAPAATPISAENKMLLSERINIAVLGNKRAYNEVEAQVTPENLTKRLQILKDTLVRDFNIDIPRIAVLSLNPQNDKDTEGTIEHDIIAPTITEAFNNGICCMGPYSADKFFGDEMYKNFDMVLAMNYDQVAGAYYTISQNEGVSYIGSLPAVITGTSIDCCFDKAGKNVVDESSFRNAIYKAIDIYRNRSIYDKSHSHPLQKQYHEKRDDSDKLKDMKNEDA